MVYSDMTQHPKGAQKTKSVFKIEKIIYDPAKSWPNHRDANSHGTNIITGPRCSAKYGRSFAGEFLLYKLQTWLIRKGLRSD